jgi:hypothetical protein
MSAFRCAGPWNVRQGRADIGAFGHYTQRKALGG